MAEKCGLEGNSAFAKGFFLGVIGVALCAKDCVEAMQYSINNLKEEKEKYLQDTSIHHLKTSKGKNRNKGKLSLNRIGKYTDQI